MISVEELLVLIKDIESDRVERTISTNNTDKFGEAICAFANDMPYNQKAGYLIIGVDDKGTPKGLSVTDELLKNLAAIRSDGNIVPPPALSVQKFVLDGGEIAVVEVQPHFLPPVRYKQKVWIRNGPRKATAGEAEERILSERRSHYAKSFDALPCMGSSLVDLSIDLFKTTYLPAAVDPEIIEANGRDLRTQLASLKFYDLKADCPTHAGILLFGLNPKFYLPGAYIQYVKFLGDDEGSDVVTEKEFSGALITELINLDGYLKDVIVTERIVAETHLREKRIFNYPFIAIREMLMNAIMHRDYQSFAPIRFYQFSDRIEIINPGGLFGIARDNFPTRNDYRNPTLAEALKNLGYINRFNRGVIRTRQELQKNESMEPRFLTDQLTSFGVIIHVK